MGPNEERVREEMARDADMARGLGMSGLPSLADMRYYGDALSEAILMDYPPTWDDPLERAWQAEWNRLMHEAADATDLEDQVEGWENEGGAIQ